jgi:hypothetical protein
MRRFPEFADYLRGRLGSRRDGMHGRLAEHLGVHQSFISACKKGESPGLINCVKVALFFGDDPEEVLSLVGKEAEWRGLKGLFEGFLAGELVSAGEAVGPGLRIPVVGHVEAGDVELEFEYDDQGFPPGAADEYLTPGWELGDANAYGLVIRGDSMEPLFRAGDRVVVSPARPFVPKRLFVVRSRDGKVWLKRVERHGGTYSLLSVNPAYPPIYLAVEDVEWLHAVTWVRFSI